jgi:hypothetical protein
MSRSAVAADQRVVVAVFDAESKGVSLPPDVLSRLSDYVASRLASTSIYAIVPQADVRNRIQQAKAESYKDCYDQACQIEIGKELAAQKTLSTSLLKLGSSCVASLTLFDLRTAATEKAVTSEGGCAEDEIIGSLKNALAQLSGRTASLTTSAPVQSAPARVEPAPRTDWSGLTLEAFAGGSAIPLGLNHGRLVEDAAGPSFAFATSYRFDLGPVYAGPILSLEIMPFIDVQSTLIIGVLPGGFVAVPLGPFEIKAALLAGVRHFKAGESPGVSGFVASVPGSTTNDFTFAADAGATLRLFDRFGVGGFFRYADEAGMTVVSGFGGVTLVL